MQKNTWYSNEATGEVMAIGATFEEAIMKAVRGTEIGHDCLISPTLVTDEEIKEKSCGM